MVSKLIPIPVPLKGLNTVEPDLPIDALYARELTNLLIVNGRLRQRPSVKYWHEFAGATDETCWWDNNYAIMRNATGDITRLSNNVVTGNIGGNTSFSAVPLLIKHNTIELLLGILEPRNPDGPSFTPWSFTTIGITDTDITCGTSHKGRLYVAAGTVIEYSNVAAVSGTMAGSFDVGEFTDGEGPTYLHSFNTQTGQANDENIFVIITENKTLIYAGDFPASQTWNLIASFSIGTSKNLVKEIDGDLFMATDSIAFYLSDLLQQGVSPVNANPRNAAIKNLWEAQNWNFSTTSPEYPHIWYHQGLDIIVCSSGQTFLQKYFGYLNEQVSFCYHRKYDAWSVWAGCPFFNPVIQSGATYRGNSYQGYIGQLATDDFDFGLTGGIKIEMSWKTPFVNPFKGQIQQVLGARPRWRYKRTLKETGGDTNNTTAPLEVVRSVFDYTDYVVSASGANGIISTWPFYQQATANVAVVNPENYAELSISQPANTSGNYAPFAGLNGIGEGVGLHIVKKNDVDNPDDPDYLQTSTTEFEIYGATLYAKDGGVIF